MGLVEEIPKKPGHFAEPRATSHPSPPSAPTPLLLRAAISAAQESGPPAPPPCARWESPHSQSQAGTGQGVSPAICLQY